MTNSSTARNWIVFSLVVAITLAAASAWLATVELVDDNIRVVLRYSARLAFGLLIVIIAARPMQQLRKQAWTMKLLRNRRLIGVAFAGVMTTHLILIMFRFSYSPELTYPIGKLIFGGSAYALIYLLFITSFDGPTRALGPRRWKILHRTGLIWAGFIFGVPRPLAEITNPEYLMFGIPLLIALIMRFLVWLRSKSQDNRRSPA